MRLVTALLALATSPIVLLSQIRDEVKLPDTVLFGAAYYEEYAPTDRLDRDIALMKAARAACSWDPGVLRLWRRIK